MRLWRVLVGSRRGRIVLAVAVCYLLWQGWLTLWAPGKLAPGLGRTGQPVDVVVTLRFPPERFHVLVFQRFGRVSGTEGNRVEVRGVKPWDLRAVARPYWVARVDPLETDKGREPR